MANDEKKKKKKPKHTNLVAPGKNKKKKGTQNNNPNRTIYQAYQGQQEPELLENKQRSAPQPKANNQPFDVTNAPIDETAITSVLGVGVTQNSQTKKPEGTEQENKNPKDVKQPESINKSSKDDKPKPKGQTTQFPVVKKQEEPEVLPANAKKLPPIKDRQKKAIKAGRRKKRMRWIKFFVGVAVAVCLVLAYFAGVYASVITSLADTVETIRISASSGKGFPNDFTVSGYKQSGSMGNNGFAALGDKDMAIMSSKGRELLRIQHGYPSPSMAVGENRVCVYNRGSSEYILTNRTKVLQKSNAAGNVLFAELSNNGSFLLATATQYRSTVEIFDPTSYETWRWSWSSSEDTPISASFANDNTTVALACVNPSNATMSSTIYIFKTDRAGDKGAQKAAITVENGVPVQMMFVGSKLLVVYDSGFAALYNKSGEELARYNYDGAVLHTANLTENGLVLLFGASFQDNTHMVSLNTSLEVLGETTISNAIVTQAMVGRSGIFVLAGQEVFGYSKDLAQRNVQVENEKNYALVWGGQPILLNANGALSLNNLLEFNKVASVAQVNGTQQNPEESVQTPASETAPQPQEEPPVASDEYPEMG